VQQKCWHWDAENDWPPFVAHRDVYVERDRCSGARSRDVQWDGGFKQSLLAEGSFDPNYQNTNDCPLRAFKNGATIDAAIGGLEDGANCADTEAPGKAQAGVEPLCDLGTNLDSCGIHKDLVVFGFSHLLGLLKETNTTTPVLFRGLDEIYQGTCISKVDGTDQGKWVYPTYPNGSYSDNLVCLDGGPGAVGDECYYGTHSACGKRRFAFKLEDAGPDIPDDSCGTGTFTTTADTSVEYGAGNSICEDGLMWSIYAPGKNPCAPNTDVTDCGYRPTKRPTRVGQVIAKDDCEHTGIRDNATALCVDYSDDLFHGKDIGTWGTQGLKECGRGTQTQGCQAVADTEVFLRTTTDTKIVRTQENIMAENQKLDAIAYALSYDRDLARSGTAGDQREGTVAYVSHRYHEKVAYINPNLAGKGQCVSPANLLHIGGALVRLNLEKVPSLTDDTWKVYDSLAGRYPNVDLYDTIVYPKIVPRPTPRAFTDGVPTTWFGSQAASLETSLRDWPKAICSDGGEGSVRIPFHFGASPVGGSDVPDATASTKFFYDFGCPYGSQQGVCPDREGLDQYQKTLDELDQPSGPAFSNCFDVDVPDFECCRAETSFRIHGQGGTVGNTGSEDLEYCALQDFRLSPDPPNLRKFTNFFDFIQTGEAPLVPPASLTEYWGMVPLLLGTPDTLMESDVPTVNGITGICLSDPLSTGLLDPNRPCSIYKMVYTQQQATLKDCMAYCDSLVNNDAEGTYRCNSFTYAEESFLCRAYTWKQSDYTGIAGTQYSTHPGVDFSNSAWVTQSDETFGYWPDSPLGRAGGYLYGTLYTTDTTDQSAYVWDELPNTATGVLGKCPLHWTSYHHTPTGCKDFCAAAFDRIGDDDTCMPGKPECANWLDSDNFPTEYVTVNAECICGAKLEDLQDSGKYVHTGTVLQDTRARARRVLHEDAAKDNDNDRWSWPDSVMAGIDQIHGNHFDAGDACVAEIMSFRTDLLNNSRCDDYLTMGAPPMDEWDPTNTSVHAACADDGSNDDACCVVNRGEAQASRVWRQMGDMTTSSVDQAFGISSIVGTAVHTSRVAAVGNFVSGAASLKP